MCQSKDEYIMLREEMLHLSTLEDNIINLLYIFVATMMAFSFKQEDTIFILILYVVIIPAYKLVISKEISIYKIGAYLYVFHENEMFNWERRSSKFYAKLPKIFKKRIPTFNYPFIYI